MKRILLLALLLPLGACSAVNLQTGTEALSTFHKTEAALYVKAPCSISLEGYYTLSADQQEGIVKLCAPKVVTPTLPGVY